MRCLWNYNECCQGQWDEPWGFRAQFPLRNIQNTSSGVNKLFTGNNYTDILIRSFYRIWNENL